MVVDHQYTVLITEEGFTYDGEKLIAESDSTRLPCNVLEQDCRTSEATYFWDSPNDHCELGTSKMVEGIILKDEDGQEVFMSTDQSKVRLVMGHQESRCGRMVYSTNYDELFLFDPAKSSTAFTRRMDPMAVSISTYVGNRDDFLYHHVINQINEELTLVLQDDCRKHRRKLRQDFFLEHANPGIVTYGFGNGTFATASGEVIYYHQCRKELVVAAELPDCYDALPVHLPADAPLNQYFNATQWFVEPLTKRLTRYASVVPCTKSFSPKYRLYNGKWISVDPHIRVTEAPKPMMAPERVVVQIHPDKDFSKGGVYDVKDLKAWEAFTFIGRIREATASELARSISREYTRASGDMEFQTPDQWFEQKLTGFVAFLQGWGNAVSIFMSLLFFWNMFSGCTRWIVSGTRIYQDLNSCIPSLLWGLCPDIFLLRRKTNRNATNDTEMRDRRPSPEHRPILRNSEGRAPGSNRNSVHYGDETSYRSQGPPPSMASQGYSQEQLAYAREQRAKDQLAADLHLMASVTKSRRPGGTYPPLPEGKAQLDAARRILHMRDNCGVASRIRYQAEIEEAERIVQPPPQQPAGGQTSEASEHTGTIMGRGAGAANNAGQAPEEDDDLNLHGDIHFGDTDSLSNDHTEAVVPTEPTSVELGRNRANWFGHSLWAKLCPTWPSLSQVLFSLCWPFALFRSWLANENCAKARYAAAQQMPDETLVDWHLRCEKLYEAAFPEEAAEVANYLARSRETEPWPEQREDHYGRELPPAYRTLEDGLAPEIHLGDSTMRRLVRSRTANTLDDVSELPLDEVVPNWDELQISSRPTTPSRVRFRVGSSTTDSTDETQFDMEDYRKDRV